MLDKFVRAKQPEIELLETLQKEGCFPAPLSGPRRSFLDSLRQQGAGAVIAEYKRASPSRGDIAPHLRADDVACAYAEAGAGAVSILTEQQYFRGSMSFLQKAERCGLPMLRKDFIFHELQVRQTAASPASAVLLIARMLRVEQLAHLAALCEEYGLTPVTEVFDAEDLSRARRAGARVIQVNNRDLATLTTSLDNSRELSQSKQDGEFWISASGISHGSEIDEMADCGFDAVLVGTSLMEGGDPGVALRTLLAGRRA
ncbi:indole-3-glycerol-phosphate synthase [Desulfobaculum bizertense]|uniref:indole-3-glycerol phosphate synthase TrpC n=1 Tax=Desulfobaculum bizertense TaxID=376490 RepID=UPI001F28AE8C|nr:indole-3-glycerol-phosphate synthase [Desulfobaculum bizertense]UIJ37210.1 indole-3-glycerol-phosphate synthase [Desulfobaculum bizertense]